MRRVILWAVLDIDIGDAVFPRIPTLLVALGSGVHVAFN